MVSRGRNNFEEVELEVLNHLDDFDYENRLFDIGDVSFIPSK